MKSLYRKGISFVRIDEINISLFNSAIYMTAILLATIIITPAFAEDTAKDTPTPQQTEMMMDCNLAARNSLINGDINKVVVTCTKAKNEMEKMFPGKGYEINPMLNMAFTYSLAGAYDLADPIIKRAEEIGKKLYEPGSVQMKKINDFIRDHEGRKNNPPKLNNTGIKSPH